MPKNPSSAGAAFGREIRASANVLRAVRLVRRRWRAKLLLRGLAIAGAGVLLAFVGSALGLEALRFESRAVNAFRVVLWLATGFLLVRFVFWPLLRRVSDERVALYLEEHEPALQSGVLAAVEAVGKRSPATPGGRPGRPPRAGPDGPVELQAALVERAAEACRRIDYGKGIERSSIRRFAGALGGLALVSAALAGLGPGFLRHGATALFLPARPAKAVNPYRVSVAPGDTTIARNSDLRISATLHGFGADDVVLYTMEEDENGFAALPMIADGAGAFDGLLLNVARSTRYYVESSGVRSATFTVDVADLPAVDDLAMEYHFPAYTGLAPRRFEVGGDVAALAGTRVELSLRATLPSPGALLVMDAGDTLAMRPASGPTPGNVFEGSFTVDRHGFYGIRLQTADGVWVAGAPDYRIDVLADQGPAVSFAKPGRDAQVSAIEEVFVEVRAEDDIGVSEVLWVYSVNGGSPDTVRIFGSGRGQPAAGERPLAEVAVGHAVFMEEFGLETGDLIAYHAVARDNAPVPNQAMTDIYFLQVRPFRRDFREAQGRGGGGGGGAGGEMEQELSAVQRQIIAASFNLARDRDSYDPDTWDENVVSVALSQQRLREQVETLAERIGNRGIAGADEAFARISEALPRAAEAMREAEDSLRAANPSGAVPAEQRSLRELQKAEETYERFVATDPPQGGGGGQRGGGPTAEDLVDLFELETDKLRNQYETVQRSRQQTADQGVDESLEKLRELARRQEQELERQRRRAAVQQGGSPGGGGQAARELAEEAEEAARQLERLSRETGDRSLDEVSRELQQAADAMRRAATGQGAQGVAEAQSALRRLRDARERLEGAQEARLGRDVAEAQRRADRLAERQEEVQNRMRAMERAGRPSQDQTRRIFDAKESMAEETGEILDVLDRAAASARREGREGAAELEEAAASVRDTQLRERLLYSRGLVGRPGQEEYARAFENQTAQAIQSLRNRLDEAAEAVRTGQGARDPEAEALESARDLVRSLESMERRSGGGAGAPAGTGGTRGVRREARERASELRALAELVAEAGADPSDLEAMIAAMRALDRDRTYDDPDEVRRLRSALVESMKQVEFRLRREFAAPNEEHLLHLSGDVPEAYRELVEEYFRALSRSPSAK